MDRTALQSLLARYNGDEGFSREAFLDAVLELAGAPAVRGVAALVPQHASHADPVTGGDPRFRHPQRRSRGTGTGTGSPPVSIRSRTR